MKESNLTLEEKNSRVMHCQTCETNTLEWNAIEGRKALFICSNCGRFHYAYFIGEATGYEKVGVFENDK